MMMTRSSNEPAQRGNPRGSLKLQLNRDPEAPSLARAAVMGGCEDCALSASVRHTLVLLVSELVSNAVLHSRAAPDAPITLTASLTADAVCVAVTDAGGGFTPVARKPDATHGGYGLYLLEKAASRWGVDRTGGTRVWFELPRTV
jgi:anti-sigma regulatory factor (Ser/Thr protein kinase)